MPPPLEAKLVILGFQGVGKTSLVHRFIKNEFVPSNQVLSTVGSSFLTSRVHDPETDTAITLQIWDTAGQERFRAISRLYYRGANAAIIAYDVTSNKSFEDAMIWLQEVREHCGEDIIIHVVGTKTDLVAGEPQRREVAFERCISSVTERLWPGVALSRPRVSSTSSAASVLPPLLSTVVTRQSEIWSQESISDCCHEISAKDGEGTDEVFRVITRKLVDQHNNKAGQDRVSETLLLRGKTPRLDSAGNAQGYFDLPKARSSSFRIGYGDRRRSWLGLQLAPASMTDSASQAVDVGLPRSQDQGRCC